MARHRTLPSPPHKRHGKPQEAAVLAKGRRLRQYEGAHPSRPVVTIEEPRRKLQVLCHLLQRQRLPQRLCPLQSRVSQEERTESTNQGKDAEEEALAQEVMRTSSVDAEAHLEDAIEIAREKKRTIVGQVEIVGRDLKRDENRHDLTEKGETMEAAGMTVPGLTETEIERAIEVVAAERGEHTRVLLVAELTQVRLVTELSWLALSSFPIFQKLKRLLTYRDWWRTLLPRSSVFSQELSPLSKSTKYKKPWETERQR